MASLGWRVVLRPLDRGTELYDPTGRVVYLDPAAYAEDPPHALAHAAGHIRYDVAAMGPRMSRLQEACANDYAYLWLDREPAL